MAPLSFERKKEKEEYLKFIQKKCETTEAPLNMSEMAKEFISNTRTKTRLEQLAGFAQEFKKRVWNIPDRNKLVRQLFGLSIPIDVGQRVKLRRHAEVVVMNERIIKYVANDGSLKLEIAVPQPSNDKEQFIEFLVEKCKNARWPLSKKGLAQEYVTREDSTCASVLIEWIDEYRRKVGRMPGLDKKTRIKQMFVLRVRITGHLLTELKEDALVERNKKLEITKYISNDGKIRIENFHCWTDGEEENDQLDPTPPAPKKPRTSSGSSAPSISQRGQETTQASSQEEPTGSGSSALSAPKKRKATRVLNENPSPLSQLLPVKLKPNREEEAEDVKPEALNLPVMQDRIETESPEILEDIKPEVHQEQPLTPEVPQPRTLTIGNHKKLLESFASVIEVMELPMDSKNLKDAIRTFTSYQSSGRIGCPKLKKVELDNLLITLGYSIMKVQQNPVDVKPDRDARSLKEYLNLVHFAMIGMGMEELEQVKKQLKEAVKNLEKNEVLIPVTKINESLQLILDILIPI